LVADQIPGSGSIWPCEPLGGGAPCGWPWGGGTNEGWAICGDGFMAGWPYWMDGRGEAAMGKYVVLLFAGSSASSS